MKKIILFSILGAALLLSNITQAQYIPLLLPENQWNEYSMKELPPEWTLHHVTYITKLGGIVNINDVDYYELLTTEDETATSFTVNGYIREDVESRKVYYIPLSYYNEILLYDFNAEVGDEIYSYDIASLVIVTITIEAVDYVLIADELRKKMTVRVRSEEFGTEEMTHTWIEGVGNMNGLTNSTLCIYAPGTLHLSLLCFFQNEELIYKPEDTTIEGCFAWELVSIDSYAVENIAIYPNPVADILTISSQDNAISQIEIYTTLGEKIYNQVSENTIDVSFLSKGVYILRVYDTTEQSSLFKIIKK